MIQRANHYITGRTKGERLLARNLLKVLAAIGADNEGDIYKNGHVILSEIQTTFSDKPNPKASQAARKESNE